MTLASCIGCGCDDLHACVDDLGPCSWIVVDRDAGRGVCSCCEAHMERWNAGDRSVLMLVAKITRDGETEPYFIEKNGMGSFPYFLEVEAGDKFSLEWVEMSQEQMLLIDWRRDRSAASALEREASALGVDIANLDGGWVFEALVLPMVRRKGITLPDGSVAHLREK